VKSLVITALAFGMAVTAALAQTPSPSPATTPEMQDQKAKTPLPSAAANKQLDKQLIRRCYAEAKSKTWFFRRTARREALIACVARTNPRLARYMKCHHETVAKGVRGREKIRTAVKACMA
jgi:hypothetical protein